jgi:Family of unknown function (DUF5677)
MEGTLEEVEKFATKLERASERVFETASIWNTEPQAGSADPKVVAVLLLIRTLSNFRSTLILLHADCIVEARTIARCCFENLFTIAALREGGQRFVLEMGEDFKASRKARAEFLMQQTGDMPNTEWQPKLRAFIASLGRGQKKRKSLDPKRVAARGPLLKGYAYYSELSADAAHPTLDALQRYLGHAQGERHADADHRYQSAGKAEGAKNDIVDGVRGPTRCVHRRDGYLRPQARQR